MRTKTILITLMVILSSKVTQAQTAQKDTIVLISLKDYRRLNEMVLQPGNNDAKRLLIEIDLKAINNRARIMVDSATTSKKKAITNER
jgi:hypothetical protein